MSTPGAALIHASCAHACRGLQARLLAHGERINSSLAIARDSARRLDAAETGVLPISVWRAGTELQASQRLLRIVMAQALDDLRSVVSMLPEMRDRADHVAVATEPANATAEASAASARSSVMRLATVVARGGHLLEEVSANGAPPTMLLPGLEFVVLDAVRQATNALEVAAQARTLRATDALSAAAEWLPSASQKANQ